MDYFLVMFLVALILGCVPLLIPERKSNEEDATEEVKLQEEVKPSLAGEDFNLFEDIIGNIGNMVLFVVLAVFTIIMVPVVWSFVVLVFFTFLKVVWYFAVLVLKGVIFFFSILIFWFCGA